MWNQTGEQSGSTEGDSEGGEGPTFVYSMVDEEGQTPWPDEDDEDEAAAAGESRGFEASFISHQHQASPRHAAALNDSASPWVLNAHTAKLGNGMAASPAVVSNGASPLHLQSSGIMMKDTSC